MLTSAPAAINRSARLVVLRHPNAFEVVVHRKSVKRVETIGGVESEMGGSPTLGGMGVLRSEDEAEFDYEVLGEGKLLFTNGAQPVAMNEQGSAQIVEAQKTCLIESKAEPTDAAHWVAARGDLVALNLGLGVVIAYDVADIIGNVAIPPYTQSFVLNPRDDLDYEALADAP